MSDDKEIKRNDSQNEEQPQNAISRRKLLASLGMAGVVLASTGLVNGTLGKAYADSSDKGPKVKELRNMNYVVATTISELKENIEPDVNYVYFVKDIGQQGHFYYDAQDTTSVEDMVTVLVSGSGARYKRLKGWESTNTTDGAECTNCTDDGLYEYARVLPVPPSGQITDQAEVIVPYKGSLYCLFKGSYYPQYDQSYICIVRPVGNDKLHITSRIDLGVAADARAMDIYNDDLFVFSNNKIKVYRIVDAGLQLKFEYERKLEGFVQTCRVINGRLYACNWGNGCVERYDLVNGIPSNETAYYVGAVGNASIVSSGSLHFLITWTETNNITRLDIDPDGVVYNRGTFTIPGVVLPRYAHIYNGVMTVGGYSTLYAKTVALDITSGTPVKIGEYINMPTHIRVGDYLIGSAADQSTPENDQMYWKLVKVRVSDGAVEVLSDRSLLYPVLYKSTVYGFMGPVEMFAPLGQEIACYSTNAMKKGIEIPIDSGDFRHNHTLKYTGIGNFAPGQAIVRFANFKPDRLGWLRVKMSYTIVNNQNIPGQSTTAEATYAAFKSSAGIWTIKVPRIDVSQSGDLGVALNFEVSGAYAYVSVSEALTNALIHLTIDYDLTDNNMGSFYVV